MNNIKLGDTVKDTITGFTGVVVCDSKWLHGCRRLSVQPRELKDGKPIDIQSFDEPQLELVEAPAEPSTGDTGGGRGRSRAGRRRRGGDA